MSLSKYRFAIILALIASVIVFFDLGRMDVVTDNEGQRATPPAEMVRTGDYLIPRINGVDYLVKPPLLYWAIAIVYKVSGVIAPFTARVPTALCGVGLVVSVYLLFRREVGERTARWGALALLASPYVLERMRWAELDVPLTWATFLAIVFLRRAANAVPIAHVIGNTAAGAIAFAAAILLKGPVPFLFLWVAYVATLLTSGPNPKAPLSTGLKWSLLAFGLEVVLKTAAYFIPQMARPLGTPVALAMVVIVWSALALRHGGALRTRGTSVWLAGLLLGSMLAAPWAVAVLNEKGWPYIRAMLDNQVVERTYVASEINRGTPFYFLIALVPMLMPWGLLLPLQLSGREWSLRPGAYRFSIVVGWLSVLVFSLIAGKEYEYILPGIPFLLIAAGHHLALMPDELVSPWMTRWAGLWQKICLIALPAVAVPGGIYAIATERRAGLTVTIIAMALVVLLIAVAARGSRSYRLAGIFLMTAVTILMALTVRAYHYQGSRSPRALGELCGELVRAGQPIEASKVYPAFAFYAREIIPTEVNIRRVREKLAASRPYYYLTRKDWIESYRLEGYERLAGPIEFKDLMLIGNAPLPPNVARLLRSDFPSSRP